MKSTIFTAVQQAISVKRLDAYRQSPTDDNTEIIARYVWNMHMCEALYPSLQCLEISLRNSLYNSITHSEGNVSWFSPRSTLLDRTEIDTLSKAENKLRQARKPIIPDRIIAELSFGFWTSLLSSKYEQTIWNRAAKLAFPQCPRSMRKRRLVAPRLHEIRHLRNRVFHYEPIWRQPNLCSQHAQIMETIEWISPEMKEIAGASCRFNDVCLQKTFDAIKNDLAVRHQDPTLFN